MAFYSFIKPLLYTLGNREWKFLRIPVFLCNNVLPGRPRITFPDKIRIIPHSLGSFTTKVIIHTPLHQGVIFQRQIPMSKTSGNQHLLPVFKRQHRTVCVTEGFSWTQIHSHIENRTMQARHQLRLGVFPFLKIQATQRERLLAASLVDLSNIEIYRLVVWHGKISSEVFKDWDCQDFWFCEYYWLRPSCIHCCTSFFIFVSNYMLFRKTQGVLPLCHHCFRYSLGLIPSTFRNIRLK